jgi:hypothetical protein
MLNFELSKPQQFPSILNFLLQNEGEVELNRKTMKVQPIYDGWK